MNKTIITKTTKLIKSALSGLTIMAFALVPFGYGEANVAIAQEVPECAAFSDMIVSDLQTEVNEGETVAVVSIPDTWTSIDGATWIWNDAQELEGADPGTLVFTRTFNWESDATTTAILNIATDNTYSVSINGDEVASSTDEDNFSSSDTIDISEFIVNGENSVEFTVTNLGDDAEDLNPAGLLYRIDLDGFECVEAPVTPTGEIVSPTEGQTVSGTTTLEAIYNDGDAENDDEVQWAVRDGACEVGTTTVFGNVDGLNDDYDWDGANFSSEIDTTTVDDGEYCFIFNPEDDGDTDVRETVTFNILNDDDDVATTTVTVIKEIINDDGGTATTSDFTLLVGDMEVESGVEVEIEPGVYVVDEFGTTTVNYEASFSGDCNLEGEITVEEGDNLVCTITNNDIAVGEQCTAIEFDIFSDSQTMVNGTSSVAVDIDSEADGNQIPSAWTADIDGATWIWSDAQNEGTAATGTEVFTRDFEWSSDATTTATLMIATDNTYSVSINGDEVASSTDEDNYSEADVYDVSAFMINGTNTIEITVTNIDNGGDNNPAGLLYSLDLDGFECEDIVDDDDGDDGDSGGGSPPVGDDDDDDDDERRIIGVGSGGGGGSVLGASTDDDRRILDVDIPENGVVRGVSTFVPGFPLTGAGGESNTAQTAAYALAGILAILLAARGALALKKA